MEVLPWGGARGREATPWSEVQWRAGPPGLAVIRLSRSCFWGGGVEEQALLSPWSVKVDDPGLYVFTFVQLAFLILSLGC